MTNEFPNFTPSQVHLDLIFVGTFDRVEIEVTAAIIVKALAIKGNVWRIISCDELVEVFKDLTKEDGPWKSLFNNHFISIDMHRLVDHGYASWNGPRAIKFTDLGLQRMIKWI